MFAWWLSCCDVAVWLLVVSLFGCVAVLSVCCVVVVLCCC